MCIALTCFWALLHSQLRVLALCGGTPNTLCTCGFICHCQSLLGAALPANARLQQPSLSVLLLPLFHAMLPGFAAPCQSDSRVGWT